MVMKGLNIASHGSSEARHRSAGTDDDTSKLKSKKLNFFKVEKYKIMFPENSSCKFEYLKLALFIIICCAILSIAFSPMMQKEQPILHSASGSLFVDMAKIWQTTLSDPRYVPRLDVNWHQISILLNDLNAEGGVLKIGLLNFNSTEVNLWQQTQPQAEVSPVHLEHADTSITWRSLYPTWIDEEEEYRVPACPSLPQPRAEEESRFDLVAVKLPCDVSGNWSRDVVRLHLQLAAAKVAVDSGAGRRSRQQVYVLLVSECLPIPNLFICKNLVKREGNLWLYKPELATLEEKLRLPIGSCQLAIPFESKVRLYSEFGRREAYATILHSMEKYVCGAIAVAKSIRSAGSARDLVILVDETITDHYRNGLEAAGWKVRTIQRIRNRKAKPNTYNEWNYSKFRLWQLTDYDKIIFIDADVLILRNIDFLFTMPEISATSNSRTLFNSGAMVIEPSNCTFQLLMDHIDDITSYNGGDQGYLNEIFTWWHRIPKRTNFLKYFLAGKTEESKAKMDGLFGADPPVLYVVHYLGQKPWRCFRDYDCNWNVKHFRRFASDAANAKWWKVHDALPEKLQEFCLLTTQMKAHLEYRRRQAEKEEFPDGHWRRNITDPRLHICKESFCYWESIVLHWGETNSSSRILL
ncbi:hypothetical protein Cni_G13205 [Canna indica]|uniref:Hexosyltransferase n=1 Tax=Canna indica TaxID=4628 RepID=A0AAQ3QBA8_9LILI|nr:hypothetical protein Cni_G13205 [Canna indica]